MKLLKMTGLIAPPAVTEEQRILKEQLKKELEERQIVAALRAGGDRRPRKVREALNAAIATGIGQAIEPKVGV